MWLNRITEDETLVLSARILPNRMLYVRPSFGCVTITSMSTEVGCVQEVWEQGRLFCKVSYCVWVLCALQMCLAWCVGLAVKCETSGLSCIAFQELYAILFILEKGVYSITCIVLYYDFVLR